MKGLWIVIALILAMPLFAQMDFTQKETIPIENGTFSYAELRSVEGTDRIVAYSQDTDNIYLTISDTDGNIVETVTLAMTDSTDTRKMSYFEHEGEPYLVVNRTKDGERVYNDIGWREPIYLISEIYSLADNMCVDEYVVDTLESYDEGDPWWWSSENYHAWSNQCITCYRDINPCVLYVPFACSNHMRCCQDEYYDTEYFNGTEMCMIQFHGNNEINHEFFDRIGMSIISGNIEGYPALCTGRSASLYVYCYGDFSNTTVFNCIYTNYIILSRTMSYNFYFGGVYSSGRYVLLSDNYPELPNTFSLLSVEYDAEESHYEYIFSERDLSGNVVWMNNDTTFEQAELLNGNFPSSCFTDDDDNPLTIYFAPDTTSYEIRNRLNGDIEDSGEAPFVPLNIERTEGGTLFYLASTDNGVQVWHGDYTVGIDDPTDTPRFDLAASNYPNPFNPTTTIRYSIPSTGHVELDVYNTRGQRVKTLVNDVIDAGEHEAVWHGDNDIGETVSSGVYLYRLKSDDKKRYGRMLMLK